MLAKVIAKTTIDNLPVAIGDVVEVDEITFRNLAAKGRLEEAKAPAAKRSAKAKGEADPAGDQ
jgi:hypothetical protein